MKNSTEDKELMVHVGELPEVRVGYSRTIPEGALDTFEVSARGRTLPEAVAALRELVIIAGRLPKESDKERRV